jgi:hypothetical protein
MEIAEGQEILVKGKYNHALVDYRLAIVGRMTRTGFYLKNPDSHSPHIPTDKLFRLNTLKSVGDAYYGCKILTPGLKAEWQEARTRADAIERLTRTNWAKLPAEQLQAIMAIVYPPEK